MTPLSLAQRQAEELAKKLFNWERQVEEHCVILRVEPNRYAEAYVEYAATAPPVGFTPPRGEFDNYITEAELALENDCTTFLDHLKFVNSAMLLCQVKTIQASEGDHATYLEMGRIRAELHKNHVYEAVHPVFPSNPHPLLAQELGLGQPNSTQPQTALENPANHYLEYSLVLPACPFTFDEIATFNRSPLLPDDIVQYRKDPDSLFDYTFFSSDSEDAGAFRVSAIMTTSDQGKLFYVVFADEGPRRGLLFHGELFCHTFLFRACFDCRLNVLS
ncbi:hypothetical protein C8R44DRAFT_972872 [Mycena epipterygia]|nr:hypothetical protein C8R44DRAFT_972872 [Mycena epipterygia]